MRALPRAASLLLLFLMLPLAVACEYKPVTVLIDDFELKAVEGVRFWKLDEATGTYVEDGQVVFSERFEQGGVEWVEYSHVAADGSLSVPLGAQIRRQEEHPQTVRLDLFYARTDSGSFRITTFNAMGESELSFETTTL